jgi:hypothetical protein
VEAFLATPTTAWQPMATIQPVATVARSHLSPDGGSLPRHAYHRLAADGYVWQAMATIQLSPVATCRQTVEASLATPTTAWQRMATIQPVATVARSHLSPDGGGFYIALSTAWQRMATCGKRWLPFSRRP